MAAVDLEGLPIPAKHSLFKFDYSTIHSVIYNICLVVELNLEITMFAHLKPNEPLLDISTRWSNQTP